MMPDGTIQSLLSENMCVTHSGVGYSLQIANCNRLPTQIWKYNSQDLTIRSSDGNCLSVGGALGPRANIWGRPLSDGSWAIAFINSETSNPMDLTCDSECLSVTGWESGQKLQVRDLWRHVDMPVTTPQTGISVKQLPANGGIECYKLTPVWR